MRLKTTRICLNQFYWLFNNFQVICNFDSAPLGHEWNLLCVYFFCVIYVFFFSISSIGKGVEIFFNYRAIEKQLKGNRARSIRAEFNIVIFFVYSDEIGIKVFLFIICFFINNFNFNRRYAVWPRIAIIFYFILKRR